MSRAALVVAVLAVASTARAEEARTVQPALTVGLVEVLTLDASPEHVGLYVTTSLDVAVKLSDDWALIPSFGFEFAPESGAWGGVFLIIVDRFLTQWGDVVLALEPQLGLIHDAVPDGDGGFDHILFAAGGVGVAFITSRFLVIPQCLVSYGLGGEGLSIAPTLLFSVPF